MGAATKILTGGLADLSKNSLFGYVASNTNPLFTGFLGSKLLNMGQTKGASAPPPPQPKAPLLNDPTAVTRAGGLLDQTTQKSTLLGGNFG